MLRRAFAAVLIIVTGLFYAACSDDWIEVEVEDALNADELTGLEPATPEQIAQLAIQRADRMPSSTISVKKMTREALSHTQLTTVDIPDDSLVWVVLYGGPLPDDPARVYSQVCVLDAETLVDQGCQYTSDRVPPVAQTALAG